MGLHFELDIQTGLILQKIEQFIQKQDFVTLLRSQLFNIRPRQFLHLAFAIGGPFQRVIMHNDQFTILGHPDIRLEAPISRLVATFKCHHRVFIQFHTSAPMRKYTHLGSGFKLALRDLEIRGAGNILGAEQSGHINAIGFNLYCQLLRTVTSQLKGVEITLKKECNVFIDFVDYSLETVEGKIPAAFPEDYINSSRLRLDAYRRIAMINDLTVLESFRQELRDIQAQRKKEAEAARAEEPAAPQKKAAQKTTRHQPPKPKKKPKSKER